MLVEAGSNVNQEDDDKSTPLHIVLDNDYFDVYRYLIECGADVNKEDQEGRTPLYIASDGGHTKIVQYLLQKGALVDVGCPTLSQACAIGNIEIVKMLVEAGSNINQEDDYDNRTPLHDASGFGHFDVVRFLIANGADLKKKDKNGYTPLYVALQYEHAKLAQYLFEKEASVDEWCSPLY